MRFLHFDQPPTSAAEKLALPSVLRQPPVFVGPLSALPEAYRGVHTLKVAAISRADYVHRLDLRTIARVIRPYLYNHSMIATDAFFSDWVLLWGEPARFERHGTIVSDGRPVQEFEIGVIEGQLQIDLPSIARGNYRYSPAERLAHGVVGAQLYKTQQLLAGAYEARFPGTPGNERAYEILDACLTEFRPLMRTPRFRHKDAQRIYRDGYGPDEYVYRYLVRTGRKFIRDLFGGSAKTPSTLGNRLKETAISLVSASNTEPAAHPIIKHALANLDFAIRCSKRAHALNKHGVRRLRLSDPNNQVAKEGPCLVANQAAVQTILGAKDLFERNDKIYRLTHLAVDFDIDPLWFWPQLEAWRVHFAAARWVGTLHRSTNGNIDMSPAQHWGIKGLLRSAADEGLDPDTARARKFLRQNLPDGIEGLDIPAGRIELGTAPPAKWTIKGPKK